MSKNHHHRHNMAEQVFSNANNAISESGKVKALEDEQAIRSRAYEIYCDKGGCALDNWLEAEQILK